MGERLYRWDRWPPIWKRSRRCAGRGGMLRFRDVWLTRFPRLLDSSFGTTRNPVNPTGEASARRPVPLPLRASLVALLALVGVNALAGGYYAVSGAPGVPVEWLRGTPFQSYLIPGLILFCVVGGSA